MSTEISMTAHDRMNPEQRLERIARLLVRAMYLWADGSEADHTNGPENVVGDVAKIGSHGAISVKP